MGYKEGKVLYFTQTGKASIPVDCVKLFKRFEITQGGFFDHSGIDIDINTDMDMDRYKCIYIDRNTSRTTTLKTTQRDTPKKTL